jgi:hypothetical protein
MGSTNEQAAFGDLREESIAVTFLAKASNCGSTLFHSCLEAWDLVKSASPSSLVTDLVLQPAINPMINTITTIARVFDGIQPLFLVFSEHLPVATVNSVRK